DGGGLGGDEDRPDRADALEGGGARHDQGAGGGLEGAGDAGALAFERGRAVRVAADHDDRGDAADEGGAGDARRAGADDRDEAGGGGIVHGGVVTDHAGVPGGVRPRRAAISCPTSARAAASRSWAASGKTPWSSAAMCSS